MTLSELYRLYPLDEPNSERARKLLQQTHWFTVNAVFDPKTGEALPQSLSAFLSKVAQPASHGSLHDRLWRITEHALPSVERLFRALNESPRREQAMLPVCAVRELDATSFIKLSNRPGRNIREKLAGKPYLQAVRRFQSVNLPENRLLKAFVTRLGELLELRQDCLGEEEDELLPKIRSWLLSGDARAISHWDNLPPKNTLLSHRDYSCVWDSWCWLQTIDDDIAHDFYHIESRETTMRLWNDYAQTYREGTYLFADMPVLFGYEDFSIRSWDHEVKQVGLTINRTIRNINTVSPVCVDLAYQRPHFACSAKTAQVLPENYLWQQWGDNNRHFDMVLFAADAAYLHPDATSISSTDLFFSKGNTSENLDRAARAFADRLRAVFKNDTLTWLVPDFLNDFELEITRRNLNARFPNAEPLPRSVAAVFEQVDYSKIRNDGYSVVVVDTVGGKTCVTKLIARFDQELKIRIPETSGFYWERCPPVVLSHQDADETASAKRCYDMITVNANGKWRDPVPPEAAKFIDPNTLRNDTRIGQFAYCINVTHSPVSGGMRLHALQQRADGIPLWRDQIPELSIKVKIEGLYRRFYLVSRGTTVKPIRGLPVKISVDEDFKLPEGKQFYQFPLYQGENDDELGFSVRLDSPAFPLKTNAVCELNLTFEYGADEPYKLVFTPRDKSFPPIHATWRHTVGVVISDAPSPQYPAPLSWDDLRSWHDAQGNEVDLFEWIIKRFDKLRKTSKGWGQQSTEEIEERTFYDISRRAFVNRIGLMWADARSLDDNADHKFTEQIKRTIQAIISLREKSQRIELCVWQILSCLHKDTPSECVQWITEQVENDNIFDPRAVGFALGDISEEWQIDLFRHLVSNPNTSAISVFAYAIWREQHVVEKFSIEELRAIQNVLLQRLIKINSVNLSDDELKDKWSFRKWVHAVTETLELLLGLLRTRASTNPEIKMLLQPHQKITKELAKQVEQVTEIVAQSNLNLYSRVQLNIQKPDDDRTPDLLYALRLYLTGDDGANAIHITSVSDNDND
jgi:hypothetical protein